MSSYENQEKHRQNTQEKKAPQGLSLGFLAAMSIFFMITLGILVTHKDKQRKIIELLRSPAFVFSIVIIVGWSYYWLYYVNDDSHDNYKKATKQAIIGFIIALLAHLELKVAPFWLIWITAYYLDV